MTRCWCHLLSLPISLWVKKFVIPEQLRLEYNKQKHGIFFCFNSLFFYFLRYVVFLVVFFFFLTSTKYDLDSSSRVINDLIPFCWKTEGEVVSSFAKPLFLTSSLLQVPEVMPENNCLKDLKAFWIVSGQITEIYIWLENVWWIKS